MRLPALLATAFVLLLPGCLQGVGDGLGADMDCTAVVAQEVAQTADLLVPEQTPPEVPDNNPSVTIEARGGQTVTAQAVFQAGAGNVAVDYDGPEGTVTTGTTITWQLIAADVPAGPVTLGLAGDPLAFGVQYTLQLTATGCTPA